MLVILSAMQWSHVSVMGVKIHDSSKLWGRCGCACVGTATRFQGVCSSAIVKEVIENFYAIHDLLPSLLGEF